MSYAGDERWPSARDYAEWARREGCVVATHPAEPGDYSLLVLAITAPSGAVATEIVTDMADPLVSTTIARLDRRLALKSAFFR